MKEGAETESSALAKRPETWVEEVQLLFWVPRKYQHRPSVPFIIKIKSKECENMTLFADWRLLRTCEFFSPCWGGGTSAEW